MCHEFPSFFHKSIKIYIEVIILGVNTLYSVFIFFMTLLLKQVYAWLGKGFSFFAAYMDPVYSILQNVLLDSQQSHLVG